MDAKGLECRPVDSPIFSSTMRSSTTSRLSESSRWSVLARAANAICMARSCCHASARWDAGARVGSHLQRGLDNGRDWPHWHARLHRFQSCTARPHKVARRRARSFRCHCQQPCIDVHSHGLDAAAEGLWRILGLDRGAHARRPLGPRERDGRPRRLPLLRGGLVRERCDPCCRWRHDRD